MDAGVTMTGLDPRFGIAGVVTEETHDPATVGRMVEQAGFGALYLGEHTHIPASRETPYPGGPLKRDYWHTLDLFVALTATAAATNRLRIGSGVCQIAQRDPIILAKEMASLDLVSGGRTEFVVGGGWNREEMRNHGTDPRTRFAVMRERVAAIRAIWSEDEASFHGRFVDFERIWCWPKPQQHPPPPILLAGNGPRAEDRVLDYGDGWGPLAEPGLAARIRRLRARADETGRRISVAVFAVPPAPRAYEEFFDAGADRCVHWTESMARGAFERELENVMAATRAVAPA
jgi:probable F420-dependent oxidoreductase